MNDPEFAALVATMRESRLRLAWFTLRSSLLAAAADSSAVAAVRSGVRWTRAGSTAEAVRFWAAVIVVAILADWALQPLIPPVVAPGLPRAWLLVPLLVAGGAVWQPAGVGAAWNHSAVRRIGGRLWGGGSAGLK